MMTHQDDSQRPRWSAVQLVYLREMRDQLRDRRTLFTIVVLPIILYPLLGSLLMQIAQFARPQGSSICLIGDLPAADQLPLVDPSGNVLRQYSGSDQPLRITFHKPPLDRPAAEVEANAKEWIFSGIVHAVGLIAPAGDDRSEVQIKVLFSSGSDVSRIAGERLASVLKGWERDFAHLQLAAQGMDISALQPLAMEGVDIAPPQAGGASFWSKLLPFVMLVWALTGAFYPAVDLVAGEKERGTLETLLSSPALRSEIVIGKWAAVTTFSIATSVLNVLSMLLTGSLVTRHLFTADATSAAVGLPAFSSLLWLWVALVPLAALFSALALAVATLARSSKEGQYYLMPLMMMGLPLVLFPMMPGIELNAGTSLIPVSGMFLLARTLIEGQYLLALTHLPLVVMITSIALYLATRWAARQFEDEAVLFRGSDQWTLTDWIRHVRRDRFDEPTVFQSLGCAAVVLIGLFFARLVVHQAPQNFGQLTKLVILPQLGLILAPALLMSCMLTRSLRQSLNLRLPAGGAMGCALILGVSLHPTYVALSHMIQGFYPLSSEVQAALVPFEQLVNSAPLWMAIFVLAIVPAVCEELAFRGFVFTGLRQNDGGLRAILGTAAIFALSHAVFQQSLAALFMGLLLGWVTLRTGSLLPALMIHASNNALSLSLGRADSSSPLLTTYVLSPSDLGMSYQEGWTLFTAALSLCCLFYLSRGQLVSQRAAKSLASTSIPALQNIKTLT